MPLIADITQRINLVSRTAKNDGVLPVLSPKGDPQTPVGEPELHPFSSLNSELTDVAFVDEPIQCDAKTCASLKENYHFAGRRNWTEANQYKYHLDLGECR